MTLDASGAEVRTELHQPPDHHILGRVHGRTSRQEASAEVWRPRRL